MSPWTFDEARDACRKATQAQEAAEEAMVEAARKHAVAEESYRKALALEILRLHNEDGVAWSVTADLARGKDSVAQKKRERDIGEGVREALTHAAWRHNANRRDAQRFADWSQRREIAEGYGQTPEPEFERAVGGGG